MSKTPFSNQCVVLGGLWLFYREEAEKDEYWNSFFQQNDIGLPLAYMIAQGIAEASGDGEAEAFIDETWQMFCESINIDPEGHYETLDDAFAASPNPRLEVSE